MVHYKLVKITINAPSLGEVIINVMVKHHSLFNSMITDQESLFTSKFWFLLCYFLKIKQKLFNDFSSSDQ